MKLNERITKLEASVPDVELERQAGIRVALASKAYCDAVLWQYVFSQVGTETGLDPVTVEQDYRRETAKMEQLTKALEVIAGAAGLRLDEEICRKIDTDTQDLAVTAYLAGPESSEWAQAVSKLVALK